MFVGLVCPIVACWDDSDSHVIAGIHGSTLFMVGASVRVVLTFSPEMKFNYFFPHAASYTVSDGQTLISPRKHSVSTRFYSFRLRYVFDDTWRARARIPSLYAIKLINSARSYLRNVELFQYWISDAGERDNWGIRSRSHGMGVSLAFWSISLTLPPRSHLLNWARLIFGSSCAHL